MKLLQRKFLIVTGMVVLLLVIAMLVITRSQSFVEEHRQELRALGEKPTFAELVPNPRPDDEQHKRFTTAIRRIETARFAPGNWNYMQMSAPGRAKVAWQSLYLPQSSTQTWQEFAAEGAKLSKEIKEIRQILNDPSPNSSADPGIVATNLTFLKRRLAAQWFSGLTLMSLHYGKLDAASDNIEAIFAVQRLHGDDPTLVNQMIRVGIGGLGVAAIWEALQADGWTDPQLAKIQSAVESYETMTMMEVAFVNERNLHIDHFEMLQTNDIRTVLAIARGAVPPAPQTTPMGERILFPMWRGFFGEQDFLLGQQYYAEQIGRWRRATTHEPCVELNQPTASEQKLQSLGTNRFARIKHMASVLILPDFSRTSTTAIRHETLRRLAVAAVAIKRYQVQHRKTPDRLEALVPQFLQAIPTDCMDGKPLKYKVNPDGTFTLYSVGEDGRDDGGNATPATVQAPLTDPIFSAQDVVWPHAIRMQ